MATSHAAPRRADSGSAGRARDDVRAPRATVIPASRIRPVIGSVRPQVDGGRRPAKAAVGDAVTVEADAFADGHDVLTCDLRYRHDDDVVWSSVAMEPLVND